MTELSIRARTEVVGERKVRVGQRARVARFGGVWEFPDGLRRFLLWKGGATVVLIGVSFLLRIAVAFGVPRADWGFSASLFVLLSKLFSR